MGGHRDAPAAASPAARARGGPGHAPARCRRGRGRRSGRCRTRPGATGHSPWPCATAPSSRRPTPPGCGSASSRPPTSARSTCVAAMCGSSARGARSGSGCLAGRPCEALTDYLEVGRPFLLSRRPEAGRDPERGLPEPPRGAAGGAWTALSPRPAVPGGRPAGRRLAAHAPALVRDPPARWRCRPARRPGAAGPREPGDDPDLHARLAGAGCATPTAMPTRGHAAGRPISRRGTDVDRGRQHRRGDPRRRWADPRRRVPHPGPRRDHRVERVPDRPPARLRAPVGHRQRLRRRPGARPVLRRVPAPGPDLPARRRRGAVVDARAGRRRPAGPRRGRPGVAGRVDRRQPAGHLPRDPRDPGLHLRAGHHPVHHARLRRAGLGPHDRADPGHAPEPDLPGPRLGRQQRPQREGSLRGVGDRAGRLQPGDHRRRPAARSDPRSHRPGDLGGRGLARSPARPAAERARDRLPIHRGDRPRATRQPARRSP